MLGIGFAFLIAIGAVAGLAFSFDFGTSDDRDDGPASL